MLVAVGLSLIALLVPGLPTGELGSGVRAAIIAGSIGYGAYALPWPFVALGGLFLMRRNPKGWPRVLAGYLLVAIGLWGMLMLARPELSGLWGMRLRQLLTGAAGALSYLPALLLASIGIDVIRGHTPTALARSAVRAAAGSVRRAWKGFLALRRRLKAQAAFNADVALAKQALRQLDQDLAALAQLYPASAELGKWRKAIVSSQKLLKAPTPERLEAVRHDAESWQQALTDFGRERAAELAVHLSAETAGDIGSWLRSVKGQLNDPLPETTPPGRALDALRKALSLDAMALSARHDKLLRERDQDQAQLREARPLKLLNVHERHQQRLQAIGQLRQDAAALEQLIALLEPWRALSREYAALAEAHPAHAELADYGQTLAKALRERGRQTLGELEGWQRALASVRERLSAEAPPEAIEVVETVEAGGDSAPVSAAIDDPLDVAIDVADELADGAQPTPPAVGGIPIQLPAVTLLEPLEAQREDPQQLELELKQRVAKIDETLANFGLQGRVVASVRGPTVTRFEVEPAPGEKISRFANLSDDLALAMAVGSVRIEAPIPGKSVIGLEVPNAQRDLVRFREAVESAAFRRSRARLPLILGKSIDGEMVVGDLARMPHLLIAGSTGSGKSVAVNTLIGSLLFKFLPTELRFLMIDPKMVELTPYDGIPHLLRPVVTNPADAAGVLLGAVAHMERRYKMMSKIGAKTLDQYNDKARQLELPQLPFIAIIIDELADLMITSPKEVESAIMRLAQMARATGMHLILATQRPSVDILTSLIKVNVPARMAFAVSSGHDSRTILDSMGAERLIGMGDMLYYQPGMVKPARYQGPFITEAEIANLANFLRRQYFDDEFVEAYGNDFDPPALHDSEASGLVDWNDDKLREAAELVVSEGQASVSRLQRRLSVGHARAGKLMDSLEALGVVGPHVGSKPREVLVTLEELPNIFGK